jgi:hypothetical protein
MMQYNSVLSTVRTIRFNHIITISSKVEYFFTACLNKRFYFLRFIPFFSACATPNGAAHSPDVLRLQSRGMPTSVGHGATPCYSAQNVGLRLLFAEFLPDVSFCAHCYHSIDTRRALPFSELNDTLRAKRIILFYWFPTFWTVHFAILQISSVNIKSS